MMVTLDPMHAKKWPNSAAMYPPPTMAMLSGNCFILNAESLV